MTDRTPLTDMSKPLDLLFTKTVKESVNWSVYNQVQMHYLLWCPIWSSFPGFASRSPDIPGHCPPQRKESSPDGSKQDSLLGLATFSETVRFVVVVLCEDPSFLSIPKKEKKTLNFSFPSGPKRNVCNCNNYYK